MGLFDLIRSVRSCSDDHSEPDKKIKILILGLDNAGKTTIMKNLASEDAANVIPTVGFNVKTVQTDNLSLNVWDLGGQKRLREYWKQYLDSTDVLFYVIDSTDLARLEETTMHLIELLKEPKLRHSPVLIYANKQDLSSAYSPSKIAESLNLISHRDRAWQIQPCSARNGTGIQARHRGIDLFDAVNCHSKQELNIDAV